MTTPLQIAQHDNTDNTEDGRSEEEDTCDKGLKSDMSLALSPKTLKKSNKGCWTCKRRKIACDKTLPHCNNCLRTERICEGYGIKLLWPEAGDGRRPACLWDGNEKARVLFYQKSQNYHFLNTTYNDMGFTKNGKAQCGGISSCGFHPWTVGPSRRLAYGFETSLQQDDGTLLSYYELILSRMITTIDDNLNGFRTVLLPNALSDQTLSSKSLRQAILALSAYHLWGHEAAMPHKISAIRLLSQSIQSGEDDLVGQFATCMMLCVCDVFDVADGSWYTHLSAAKAINSQLRERGHDNKFLDTWLAYHDVLAGFSKGPSLSSHTIIPQLPSSTAQDMIIVGSLGCSPQVLGCISCTNDLLNLIEQSSIKRLPTEYTSYPGTLLRTLSVLRQTPKIISDTDPISIETSRILQTAELYRIAALIYLHRSILTRSSTPIPNLVSSTAQFPSISDLVSSSLSIIKSLGICTSPWPLFITACEVEGDEQRVKVLDAIEKMQKERRIGNVVIMREIVEGVWKRRDLRIEDANNWRAVLGEKIVSFI